MPSVQVLSWIEMVGCGSLSLIVPVPEPSEMVAWSALVRLTRR